jgi:exonuclease I
MEFELQNILIANDLCSTVADLLKLVKNSNKEIIQTAIYNVNADELVFRYVELQLLNKYPDLEKDLQIARAGKCMNTCC